MHIRTTDTLDLTVNDTTLTLSMERLFHSEYRAIKRTTDQFARDVQEAQRAEEADEISTDDAVAAITRAAENISSFAMEMCALYVRDVVGAVHKYPAPNVASEDLTPEMKGRRMHWFDAVIPMQSYSSIVGMMLRFKSGNGGFSSVSPPSPEPSQSPVSPTELEPSAASSAPTA